MVEGEKPKCLAGGGFYVFQGEKRLFVDVRRREQREFGFQRVLLVANTALQTKHTRIEALCSRESRVGRNEQRICRLYSLHRALSP